MNMAIQQDLINLIRARLPAGSHEVVELRDECVLADLGFTSLHLITLLLDVQDSIGFSVDDLAKQGLPVTVGDLLALRTSSSDD